jgi:NADPH2:quinone reductase
MTQVARTLGPEVVADWHCEDFIEVDRDVTGGRGADLIYDPVGADVCRRSTRWLACEILVVGLAGGQMRSGALNLAGQELPDRRPGTGPPHDQGPALVRPCYHGSSKLLDDGSTRPLVSLRLASDAVADGVAAPRRRDHGRQAGALVR